MIYGTAQAGWNPVLGLNLTALVPAEQTTLFSGTETPSLNLASVAIARGYSPSATDNGVTFNCSGMAVGTTIDIQCASADLDGSYLTLSTLSPDAHGNAAYTDTGRSAFYRAKISAYTTGAMPVVTAQR